MVALPKVRLVSATTAYRRTSRQLGLGPECEACSTFKWNGVDINKLVSLPAHGKQLFCQRFERNLSFANVSHPLIPSSEDDWIQKVESEFNSKVEKAKVEKNTPTIKLS